MLGDICYISEDGTIHLKDLTIIWVYGHEGMGHALNTVITEQADIPYFLKYETASIRPIRESVAQFYERNILEDLRESPETQRALGIEARFEEMYRKAQDAQLLEEYGRKLNHYAILILAHKGLGKPDDPEAIRRRIEVLQEVALNPGYPSWAFSKYGHYDAAGNLDHTLLHELIYCTRSADRALQEFGRQGIPYEGEGRSLIDRTILTGYWTAQGFEDNARLVARKHSKLTQATAHQA